MCVPLWKHTDTYPYLPLPDGVDSVADDAGAFLLAVVRQRRENAVLAGLDGNLQVRVRVKEHALLQPRGLEVCNNQRTNNII